MATYEYRCPCGQSVEQHFDMGSAPTTLPCVCGNVTHRVYSSPMVGLMGYRAKTGRKRRRNPGDDLPTPYDAEAAALAP